MDFSPFSLLVVKVFSLITGGLGAEACAQILKVPLEELEPIIADLKEGGLLQSERGRRLLWPCLAAAGPMEPCGCRLRSETGLHEAGARGLRHFHVSLQKPSSGKGDRRQSP